jgi:3-oxoacyl-[acyl-carrier-protein] synthase II
MSMKSNGAPPIRPNDRVVVTGASVHIPGADLAELVPQAECGPACAADRAHELLGRKGLLNKEPATRLALCAVHRALRRQPGAPRPEGPPDPRTAVVVSSNLGNIATIGKIAGILRQSTVRDISPLDAPNASSNVIASAIAIWFRFGGPNLMVCSGATSGLEGIDLGAALLRAGRADRVFVVGVEPDDEAAVKLYRENMASMDARAELRAGAACVVLERLTEDSPGLLAPRRSRRIAGAADLAALPKTAIGFGPAEMAPLDVKMIDLEQRTGGDLFGALGVVQLALGAAMAAKEAAPGTRAPEMALICGNRLEGWRLLHASGSASALPANGERESEPKTLALGAGLKLSQ